MSPFVHVVLTDGSCVTSVYLEGATCLDDARVLHRFAARRVAISVYVDGAVWRWSPHFAPIHKARRPARRATP